MPNWNRATALLPCLLKPCLFQRWGGGEKQYGDWQMSCDTPPGASFSSAIQNVTAEDQ